jgi:protein-S-isoprenylcysteine O-methyltransferase Ste14
MEGKRMPGYYAIGAMVLLIGMVAWRAVLLRKLGIKAIKFGQLDKKDFLIPPFMFLYLYLILANVFDWPGKAAPLIPGETVRWLGVILCALGLAALALALTAFGKSFRIGIDEDRPGPLVTAGIFSVSRNPIYTAFLLVYLGQFLIFSHWVFLVYLMGGFFLIHRQVLREESSLKKIYGREYDAYRKKVRRYI